MAKYVVKLEHRETTSQGIVYSDVYFRCAICNPYNKPRQLSEQMLLADTQEEAFVFRTRAAAEVIAATYNGRVVKLVKKNG